MIADASMSVLDSGARDARRPWVSPLHSDFLFMAPARSIRASGVLARVSLPPAGSIHGDSLFRGAVNEAFAKARRAGVSNPILIGAIPFDQARPSCLYIPQCHELFDRETVLENLGPAPEPAHRLTAPPRHIPNRETYEAGVASAVAAFRRGEASKAVLARLCELELDRPVEADWLLQRLLEQNPVGFQFRVPLADGGVLVGASPELLIRKSGATIQSNPLAGSARRSPDAADDEEIRRSLTVSEKDLREHAYVTGLMREVLEPLCDRLDLPQTPSTISTSTLWHLSTQISGTLHNPSLCALQIACALHPTPALCGYPTEAAHALIRRLEPFERGMFAGLVGWCDSKGDGEWAVAIRCGELRGSRVRLFAGAGIVEGSDPQAEWRETATKLSTMLRALGVSDTHEVPA